MACFEGDSRFRASFRRHVFVIVAVSCLITGCYISAPPASKGGTRLPNTGDILKLDQHFWVSPQGRLLFFNIHPGISRSPRFVVYDIESHDRRSVVLDEEAAHQMRIGRLPGLGDLRWGVDGSFIVFPFGSKERGRHYRVTIPGAEDESPHLEIVDEIDSLEIERRPTILGENLVRIEKVGHREIRLLGGMDGTLYARHHYSSPFVTDVFLSSLTASPDALFVGYRIALYQAGFTGHAPGYIVRLDGESSPRELGSPVYGEMQWDGVHRRVYAVAKNHSGDLAIYYWNY